MLRVSQCASVYAIAVCMLQCAVAACAASHSVALPQGLLEMVTLDPYILRDPYSVCHYL